LNALTGELNVNLSQTELAARDSVVCDFEKSASGMGRELFSPLRAQVGCAELGASIFATAIISQ
jgi:phosphogluconate dehydratase